VERPLTEWEHGVLSALLSIDDPTPLGPDGRVLRESLPHLAVTGGCGCGCPSFNLRDVRQPSKQESDGQYHYSDAGTRDGRVFMFLLVENDRPSSVDVMLPPGIDGDSPDARPDPASLVVSSPYER
jgi:hypothetical protein